jgi:transcriptional regulator with XRE-family HTH domain
LLSGIGKPCLSWGWHARRAGAVNITRRALGKPWQQRGNGRYLESYKRKVAVQVSPPFKIFLIIFKSIQGAEMHKDGEAAASPARFFGAEVREARKRAGMSQPELAAIAGYDPSYVSKVENGAITPDQKFIGACDRAFPDLHGWFVRFWEESRKWNPVYPAWFKEWLDAERQAKVVRTWEPLIIPGLLQTADYARVLFHAWQKSEDADKVERDVTARLDRKRIFEQPDPATLIAVIDEMVLHRKIGDEKTMREQLEYLVEVSMRPNISLHVVPAGVGAHTGLLGAFAIADLEEGIPRVVYLETPDEGLTSGTPSAVSKIAGMFEGVRSEALPRGATHDLIRRVVSERWTP